MPPKARPTQAAVPAPAAPVPPACHTCGPNHTVATWDHSISPEHFPGLAAVNAASSSVFGDDNVENPPVLISPIKQQTRNAAPGINKQSDIDVWGLSDAKILGKSSFIKYLVHWVEWMAYLYSYRGCKDYLEVWCIWPLWSNPPMEIPCKW